jgi:hypothetical protein
MARRATTLNNQTATAITREIDSKYDNVKTVANKITEVETVGVKIAEVETVAGKEVELTTVAGKIAEVETVAGKSAEIDVINTNIGDINNVATNMSSILNGVDVVTNLDANATTLNPGDSATATLVGSTIQLGVPKGADGVDGTNGSDGLTPQYSFSYNSSTGDLEVNVDNYVPISETDIQEW